MTQVMFTPHAAQAMKERKVTAKEVEDVVRFPAVMYRGKSGGVPSRIMQKGDLAVVVRHQQQDMFVVLTVLWRTEEQWTNEEMTKR